MKGLKPILAWANAKKMTKKKKRRGMCIQRTSAHPFEGGRNLERRRKRKGEVENGVEEGEKS